MVQGMVKTMLIIMRYNGSFFSYFYNSILKKAKEATLIIIVIMIIVLAVLISIRLIGNAVNLSFSFSQLHAHGSTEQEHPELFVFQLV